MDKVGALMSKSEQSATASLSEQIVIDLNPWHNGNGEKEKLSILKNAICDTKLIRFDYTSSQGEDTNRFCEPMGIVLKGYIWYLHGYCLLRKDFRIFRLSRIEELVVLPETFERRDLTAEQLEYRWSRVSNRETVKLLLQFKPRVKARIQDYFTHGEIVLQPDGTYLVTAVQPEDPWLEAMLLSYGPDLTILEPQSLAQAVMKKAQEIVQLYQNN
jgi:predicted DNA-binding transcriptional regulator YafY